MLVKNHYSLEKKDACFSVFLLQKKKQKQIQKRTSKTTKQKKNHLFLLV